MNPTETWQLQFTVRGGLGYTWMVSRQVAEIVVRRWNDGDYDKPGNKGQVQRITCESVEQVMLSVRADEVLCLIAARFDPSRMQAQPRPQIGAFPSPGYMS